MASLIAQLVKNLPAMQKTQARSLGWEDPLEKGMTAHSSILAWRRSRSIVCLVVTLVTPQTVAHQAPLYMGFPRQEYWSRLPFPPAEDIHEPGAKSRSPTLAGRFFTTEPPEKPLER